MNLYEINAEYREILDELYDDEGNVNQQALVKLEQNDLTMEAKVVAVACYIKNMEAEREAIGNAKKAMAEREKRFNKRIDELEGYLLANMHVREIKAISCSYFDIKLKKCPPSVDVVNEKLIPDNYYRTKTERVLDKIKMKEEMLAGVLIPGAELKSNLRLEIR